jgi:diguanylate cyclase (GGDEF)-like protein/PAS domain S-box-containing protein
MTQASILIVEDDGILALFLLNMLSKLNYVILPPVATGEDALAIALEKQPDLVLMDIQLRGEMNGITAARKIVEKTTVPVVFLTSFDQKNILDQAKYTGPYGYLVKPIAERDLITTIETALYKSKLDLRMRESEAHFRHVADNAPVLIWMSGLDALVNYVNLPWLTFTGRRLEQELGNGWAEGIHPEDYQSSLDTYLEAFNKREKFVMEYRMRLASGAFAWLLVSGVPRFNNESEFTGYIGSCVDINARKLVEAELSVAKLALDAANQQIEIAYLRERQLARTDGLTGLNNLRYFNELAGHAFEVARRYHHPLSLLMFDIDNFKNVNDTGGHSSGDQVLIQTAQVVNAQLRTADIFGRIGGDEFVIIMPGINTQQAFQMAERIRTEVARLTIEIAKHPISVTISLGIAGIEENPNDDTVETLIQHADKALYAAKAAGRNQTFIYQPEGE